MPVAATPIGVRRATQAQHSTASPLTHCALLACTAHDTRVRRIADARTAHTSQARHHESCCTAAFRACSVPREWERRVRRYLVAGSSVIRHVGRRIQAWREGLACKPLAGHRLEGVTRLTLA